MTDPKQILDFLRLAARLKNIPRHAVTGDGRRESVAEHNWLVCLLALVVMDEVELGVDPLRVLKMLLIHDLPEAITGDIPTFHKTAIAEEAHQAEVAAMQQLLAELSPPLAKEIHTLWDEFEARQTPEAQLAAALDKAEALFQHNENDLATWDADDFAYQTDFTHPRWEVFGVDPFLKALKDELDLGTAQKVAAAEQVDRAHASLAKLLEELS